MTDKLAGKHVIVVGGSSGVGLAVAAQAAAAGARVMLMARDTARLEAAARQVGTAEFRQLDLTLPQSIVTAVTDLDTVDHLVVTAGTYGVAPFEASEPEAWRHILEERLIGPLTLIKELASRLTSSIVLSSGTVSRRPTLGSILIAAATAGVESAVRALALELAPIRVNAVAFGAIDTPLLDRVLGPNKSTILAEAVASLPARRIGTADDAAEAVLFLMTNAFMSGTKIELDGGSRLI